ncbi:lysin B [Mycobacterium phage SirDuracell]|uniref:Lysin B n=7 Tax=Kostyavirus TaxID=1623284 RepID=G1DHX1_9CAUD|nr:lysin B [Mycobacterium phage Kostya]YP_008858315.1 LysB [Mycobacterium phage Nala]YP_009197703.1 lysin B [Mycobacterium phage NelitzaMV]YP_009208443.1 lysin B [Mycobacterium phage Toto]YP_009225322.1 lysin B [Mycobacterium phage Mindy]YP_009591575.1 lysin B [Mycobacterium phage Eureka]YP_009607964.1 lysin B [Mycobacterium phage SirDuracell]AEK08887.1 lysin B [Mycobacterium phage Henry]APU02859.1 lysin B [Mycobacterium phage CrystalP]ATW59583.1 lysin B [Mycobacterium phage Youngblood]AX
MTTYGELKALRLGVKYVRHTLFTVAGTWADMWSGYPADVARLVDEDLFRWQPVWYPASFGPVGNPLGRSYQESVQDGVKELIRLINATPGTFAMVGYSQGAEVVSRVLLEILFGSLRHRLKDFIGGGCFGNPYRAKGVSYPGSGLPTSGHGIAPVNLAPDILPAEMWEEWWNEGDLYAQNLDGKSGEIITSFYDILTKLQFHDMLGLAVNMFKALSNDKGIIAQVMRVLAVPLPGVIDAGRAAVYAGTFAVQGTRPHITLAETGRVARAVWHLNRIGAKTLARAS